MADLQTATSAGLREFLDWAGGRAEINPTTANALKGAVGQILQVEDEPDAVDVRSLDVEDVLDRFENRFRTKYTSGSMSTYKTRFRQAVSMYLAWLDKDPGWKTVVKTRRSTSATPRTHAQSSVRTATPEPVDAVSFATPATTSSRLVKHHLPLRPELIIEIELPVHLTKGDAERIASFVRSLAFDEPSHSAAQDPDPEYREGAG
ncbi:hypothetical protein [Amycolatopsis sp.]|uniref:hypothetical protein n=1 Tax=Amycolatopsis sp. TaxID=37632 RepID=UPI002C0BFC19|nr:hypothetical protein [Amycolatopsis sp.]HVV13493.1 hypothetical protein [Amycolatopsis sp.]